MRVLGVPDIKEFVYRERFPSQYYRGSKDAMVWGLKEAWEGGLLRFAEIDSANDGKFPRALSWVRIKLFPKSESRSLHTRDKW